MPLRIPPKKAASGSVPAMGRLRPHRRSGTGHACRNYVGGTASATVGVGVGVGANALVGGFNNSIALQPLSIEANRGLNVAAGVAEMTLTPAP